MRIEFPEELRIIRIPCTGRVDPAFVMKAFSEGADGVIIMGCHLGDCHYKEGNWQALKRTLLLKKLLNGFKINPVRLKIEWVSSNEPNKFIEVVKSIIDEIKKEVNYAKIKRK